MPEFLNHLWNEPWWIYEPQTTGVWGKTYQLFNLTEGAIWLLVAGMVYKRWFKNRHTHLELTYAATFFFFGLTDFREAFIQSAPLVAIKAIILALLLWQRYILRHRHYPKAWF